MKRAVWMMLVATAGLGCSTRPLPGDSWATAASSEGQLVCRLPQATFTTFDPSVGGCTQGNKPNGINCNLYDAKDHVYISGGPLAATLPAGQYFFAVVNPGFQNGGFLDGAVGNLSDTTAHGDVMSTDLGSGDDVGNRTFSINADKSITYLGTHVLGTGSDGATVIDLAMYDDTSNPGGEYAVAVCKVGATSPCDCKYDNFKVFCGGGGEPPPPPPPVVSGEKYYDANLNGQLDPGEVGIAGWQIGFTDSISGVIVTGADGTFTQTLVADPQYTFAEVQATNTTSADGVTMPVWIQTGNTVDQSSNGSLQADKSYVFAAHDGDVITGLDFGNVCIGAGGGLTLGFWSNKNGQALINAADLAGLDALNLRNANGSNFDPTSNTQLRNWLLNATATNMSYMLSAQLTAMWLNVAHKLVSGGSLVYAPGTQSAGPTGFASISDLINEANAALGADGYAISGDANRSYQEALKNALDLANNNRNFLQSSPASCPAPCF